MDQTSAFKFVEEIAADLSQGGVVFPTSFDTTVKLRQLLKSDTSTLEQISRVVLLDPLLAAKILQAANSVAFNPGGASVTDVRAAVQRIGVANVRTMSIAIAMKQFMAYKEMARYARLSEQLVEESRQVAAICYVIAREHSKIPPDTAMFAGLVHDIGMFYLLYRFAMRSDFTLAEDEVRPLLFEWHESIGQAVLAALEVPQELQDAVASHDQPREVGRLRELGDLLFICNCLALRLGTACDYYTTAETNSANVALIRDFETYVTTLDGKKDELAAIRALV